jgi:hypothetical protein
MHTYSWDPYTFSKFSPSLFPHFKNPFAPALQEHDYAHEGHERGWISSDCDVATSWMEQ